MWSPNAALVLLICCCVAVLKLEVGSAYAPVLTNSDEGPRLFKALNTDLLFPRNFNSSGSTTATTSATATTDSTSTPPPSLETHHQQQQQQHANPIETAVTHSVVFVTPTNEATTDKHSAGTTRNPINAQHDDNDNIRENHNRHRYHHQNKDDTATGRASQTGYPFGPLIRPLIKSPPRPVYMRPQQLSPSSASPLKPASYVVYPQQPFQRRPPSRAELNKFRGKGGGISDRFTPGEAVASSQFASHHHSSPQSRPSVSLDGKGLKIPASSNVVQSYAPAADLYSFPPNNAAYPLPSQDPKAAFPTNAVNSYSPPPSGPLNGSDSQAPASTNGDGYKYPGPVSPAYLPPPSDGAMKSTDDMKSTGPKDEGAAGADTDVGDDSVGVLPASAMDSGADMASMDSGGGDHDQSPDKDHPMSGSDMEKEYPTPPPDWLKEHPEASRKPPHDDHYSYDFHKHYPHYPEIIYDDHHHHHVEQPPVPPPPMPTPPATTAAPPTPEARVKKYSYFYIGRKLWYIPLYFTVWFSFYVLWLILKSIARHKVNLPNHYVSRRSLGDFNFTEKQEDYINQLTVSVLRYIDNFPKKHSS